MTFLDHGESARRRGDWMQTFTGLRFWPLDPRPAEIKIEDIAHSLAMKCRFGGHCSQFYSVAQHSVLVSRNLPEPASLCGLLHDAAEAYLPDVIRPIKRNSWPEFGEIEDNVLRAIATRFGLSWPMPLAVKEIDNRILATEHRDLMCSCDYPWAGEAEPLEMQIVGLSPAMAEIQFFERFLELRAPRGMDWGVG